MNHHRIDQETRDHVEALPPAIIEAWESRKTSEIADYMGMTAYNGIANYGGFTAYMEREVSEPMYDLEIRDGKRVWVKRNE